MDVYISIPASKQAILCPSMSSLNSVLTYLQASLQIPSSAFYFTRHNGQLLSSQTFDDIRAEILYVQCHVRALGGKGGFGANLRSQGGRMANKQTTNFESCRDLSGRRLRTLHDAKKYVKRMNSINFLVSLIMQKRIINGSGPKTNAFKRKFKKL